MAIPCQTCGDPVHEQTVICPHCGKPTGVARDPVAAAEVEMILERETELQRDPGLGGLLRDHRLPKPAALAVATTDDDFPTAIVIKK